MTEATNAREHEWLFRLIQSGSRTDWWLELKTLEELAMYLDATDGRYGRAFSNYLNDSDYGPAVGHGKYAAEAPLTFLAYLRGLNRNQSIVESLVGARMEAAANMASAIVDHGKGDGTGAPASGSSSDSSAPRPSPGPHSPNGTSGSPGSPVANTGTPTWAKPRFGTETSSSSTRGKQPCAKQNYTLPETFEIPCQKETTHENRKDQR